MDRPAAAGPLVLLARTEADQRTLSLEALGAGLAERWAVVRMLGAAVPRPTLVHAATRPAAVVLWSLGPATARVEAVRALGAFPLRRATAGPGRPRRRLSGTERGCRPDRSRTLRPRPPLVEEF